MELSQLATHINERLLSIPQYHPIVSFIGTINFQDYIPSPNQRDLAFSHNPRTVWPNGHQNSNRQNAVTIRPLSLYSVSLKKAPRNVASFHWLVHVIRCKAKLTALNDSNAFFQQLLLPHLMLTEPINPKTPTRTRSRVQNNQISNPSLYISANNGKGYFISQTQILDSYKTQQKLTTPGHWTRRVFLVQQEKREAD